MIQVGAGPRPPWTASCLLFQVPVVASGAGWPGYGAGEATRTTRALDLDSEAELAEARGGRAGRNLKARISAETRASKSRLRVFGRETRLREGADFGRDTRLRVATMSRVSLPSNLVSVEPIAARQGGLVQSSSPPMANTLAPPSRFNPEATFPRSGKCGMPASIEISSESKPVLSVCPEARGSKHSRSRANACVWGRDGVERVRASVARSPRRAAARRSARTRHSMPGSLGRLGSGFRGFHVR